MLLRTTVALLLVAPGVTSLRGTLRNIPKDETPILSEQDSPDQYYSHERDDDVSLKQEGLAVETQNLRFLQDNTKFEPLNCNTKVNLQAQTCTTPWSTYVGKSSSYSNEVVIKCGDCVVFDYTPTQDLVFARGIDIQGKLVFPDRSRVTVRTPYVRVQGYLEMTSSKPVNGNADIKIILTGTSETATQFTPADNNAALQTQKPGKKPFIVAGGQVTINGLQAGTPSWLLLQDVVDIDLGGAVSPPPADTSPTFRELPAGCPHGDGIFLNETFGAKETIDDVVVFPESTTRYYTKADGKDVVRVKDRTDNTEKHILQIDLLGDNFRSCLIPKQTYLLTARVRYAKSGVSKGTLTDCAKKGEGCLQVISEVKNAQGLIVENEKYSEHQSHQNEMGVWWTVSAQFEFWEAEVKDNRLHHFLRLDGPLDRGIDIEIDSVVLRAAPTFPVDCQNLVPGNGGAELLGDSEYPFNKNFELINLGVKTDSTNNRYFSVSGRKYAYYHDKYSQDMHWTSMVWDLPVGCVAKSSTYRFRMKLRVYPNDESPGPFPFYVILKGFHANGKQTYKQVATCQWNVGTWEVCEADFHFSEDMASLDPLRYTIFFRTQDAPTVNYDVDDISFKLVSGGGLPVTTQALVVRDVVQGTWDAGAQVLFTVINPTTSQEEHVVQTVKTVLDYKDAGSAALVLNGVLPPVFVENAQKVKVALLSRNIVFEGNKDDPIKADGAHLVVKKTPKVMQILKGIEFRNFGQLGRVSRYPINIHDCGDVVDTRIAKNLIRDSNQHCVVVQGSSNAEILNNVAYNTYGQCFMDAKFSELGNLFKLNLQVLAKNTNVEIPPMNVEPPPPPVSQCDELVYNGDFGNKSPEPWASLFPGGGLSIVQGPSGTGDYALAIKDGSLMQYIRAGCFESGKIYEAKLQYRQTDATGKVVQCNAKCPRLMLRTRLGSEEKFETVASVAGLSGAGGFSNMYGSFEATDLMSSPSSELRIHVNDLVDGGGVVIDNVSIREKPPDCTGELTMNSNLDQGYLGYWTPFKSGKVEQYRGANVRISNRVDAKHGIEYQAKKFIDFRCFKAGTRLQVSAAFKLLLKGTDTGASCDISSTSLDVSCPSVRIYAYNASDTTQAAWRPRIYSGAYKSAWNAGSFNKLDAFVTVPETLVDTSRMFIIVRDFNAKYDLAIDSFTIKVVDGGVQPPPNPGTPPPTPSPTFSTSKTPVPTKSPTNAPTPVIQPPPPGAKNVCPEVGQSSKILDRFGPFSISNNLCTLTKVTTVLGEVTAVVPVARSYNGKDWESAAGAFAASTFDRVGISCSSGLCNIPLPAAKAGESYAMSSYAYGLPSVRDQRARFLEMATFGTTKYDLDAWNFPSVANWVKQQMDLPMTSHREYWRKRANPRWQYSQPVGRSGHPCDPNSRWRRFSVTRKDREYPNSPVSGKLYFKNTTYTVTNGNRKPAGPYVMYIDDKARTVVRDLEWNDPNTNKNFPTWDPNFGYSICNYPKEYIGGPLYLKTKKGKCELLSKTIGNPAIDFKGYESYMGPNVISLSRSNTLKPADTWRDLGTKRNDDMYILKEGLSKSICNSLPEHSEDFDAPVFAKHPDAGYLMWDPRLSLERNTPASPTRDGGGSVNIATGGNTVCSNAPRTFLNADTCILSKDGTACGAAKTPDITLNLNKTSILKLHDLTGRYTYAIKGLRTEDVNHPCKKNLRSRWEKAGSTCKSPTKLGSKTKTSLSSLISTSKDTNPFIRDIVFKGGMSCDSGDTKVDIEIQVGNSCWRHVHPEHLSVFDMTYWTLEDTHPGNKVASSLNKANPIKKWLDRGNHLLPYPSDHPMSRFESHYLKFEYVGRFGDAVDFKDLPNELRLEKVSNFYGSGGGSGGSNVVVCGSPGEVANDPTKGDHFDLQSEVGRDTTIRFELARQREVVWTMAALYANDQLRQRMAWALSQILAIAKTAIDVHARSTEVFLQYYDIFVRNAFGSYLDILREISYSPMMAENLSYLASKSSAYVREKFSRIEFADENFAREIMQLFTTGLILLKTDGTPKLDANNKTQQVYDNADIRSVSRVWTGLDRQEYRGNIEAWDTKNRLDPMAMRAEWHDRFPKSDLLGGFVGDGYPLCEDLPKRQFLRKGARYRLLGNSALPELLTDDSRYTKRLLLDKANSPLYGRLCSPKDGKCRYPSEVTLNSNVKCNKVECQVDTVRVVQVDKTVFYEYVQPPCVEHSFFDNGRKLNRKNDNDLAVCVNPNLPVATSACCEPPDKFTEAISSNMYEIERMTFATNQKRCQNIGRQSCEYDVVDKNAELHLSQSVYHWAFTPCKIQVKVNPSGELAIVHDIPIPNGAKGTVFHVDEDTTNYFKVGWTDGKYPKQEARDCGSCKTVEGDNCLCNTVTKETVVFKSNPAGAKAILAALRIGAPDPSSFDSGAYKSQQVKDYTVYHTGSQYAADSIFEVVDDVGRKRFLKNSRSTVQLQDGYSFRNPVQFMSLVPSEANARDAVYEIEALLEHLFYHDNTAPFLCVRFIQRFGISNPSPGYVKQCSMAFRTGTYKNYGISFGKGKYGDLGATVAAILLDSEARAAVLDVDPSQGSIREPLIRVTSLMRNMDFKEKAGSPGAPPMVIFNDINQQIGQMAHEQETVFSFFLSEFEPNGPLEKGSLVSPEAQMLDMPRVVDLINGMQSMIRHGLSSCDYGFGFELEGSNKIDCADNGKFEKATGVLTFKPAGSTTKQIVDELCTLLTSGRLDRDSRQAVMNAYDAAKKQRGADAALRTAQQLIVTTPEFHTTNTVKFSGKPRPEPEVEIPAPGTPYKAVVMLMFAGGMDSFNMLVPKTCSNVNGKPDMYTQYAKARTPVHLLREKLLGIDGSGQVGCGQFGLHEQLPILRTLYNNKDLLFFANTGVLGEPSTKKNYQQKTPTQLFAHNTMQRETKVVDLFGEAAGTGVLGRLSDALHLKGQTVGAIAIDTTSIALVGQPSVSKPQLSLSHAGVNQFMPKNSATMTRAGMKNAIEGLNNATKSDSGFMASTWSSSLLNSLSQNEALYQTLQSTTVSQNFGATDIGKKFEIVAKLIKTRKQRGKNKDVFYVEMPNWDHHRGVEANLANMFAEVNGALTAFVAELKNQGIFSSTTVVQVSDFGRTLTANSGGGTDHAWGGNYFMFGGNVNGGKILGKYPSDLSEAGELNVGRGRFVPTTSWAQIWPAIAKWCGVYEDSLLDWIAPNRDSFPFQFSKTQLFN